MPGYKNFTQDDYQDYAFLSGPSEAENRSATEMSVMTNMPSLSGNTYEDPVKWYYVVFSPIDRAYSKDPEWFQIRGMSKCRDMFKKPEEVYLTREILHCEKTHVNAIVATTQDVTLRNSKIYCNKYYVYVQQLLGPLDRERSMSYITKESRERPFIRYLDFINWSRN